MLIFLDGKQIQKIHSISEEKKPQQSRWTVVSDIQLWHCQRWHRPITLQRNTSCHTRSVRHDVTTLLVFRCLKKRRALGHFFCFLLLKSHCLFCGRCLVARRVHASRLCWDSPGCDVGLVDAFCVTSAWCFLSTPFVRPGEVECHAMNLVVVCGSKMRKSQH